jgi:predicted deacylase
MSRRSERLRLGAARPGTERSLLVHRYGDPAARPKAYLHAALHADETPGLLVLHHLARMLDEAAKRGGITGHVVLFPFANPIGLDQIVGRRHSGRYDLFGGGNFNRGWPDFFEPLAKRVEGRLSADAEANVAAVRAALAEVLADWPANDLLGHLCLALAREAADADLVLDLHCDDDALMHVYLVPAHWPEARDLAAELGCRAVLLAEESGGGAFDEAFSTLWTRLARRHPEIPVPPACLAATVELRGQPDVSDALAEQDAGALFRVLQRRGIVAGDPGPLPEMQCEATDLDACDAMRAPAAGVLSYVAELGAQVRAGETLAWLIDPAADDPAKARREIVARTSGLVLSRRVHKYVVEGLSVAKIVGTEPLAWREDGELMLD